MCSSYNIAYTVNTELEVTAEYCICFLTHWLTSVEKNGLPGQKIVRLIRTNLSKWSKNRS